MQRKSKWELKEIINAIFYLTKNGCMWRDLPGEYPPWQTVYWYYHKWVKNGTWENINRFLIAENRISNDRTFQPTAAIIDSQSAKNRSTCTEKVGVDGGKLLKGRKRFYIIDTLGNLLDSFVVPANSHDGTTAAKYWLRMHEDNELLQNIRLIFADGTFGGVFRREMEGLYGIAVEIPDVPIARKGKATIHEKRWIVERTISWTLNNRRCAKDYERKTHNANAFLLISNIRRLVRKI